MAKPPEKKRRGLTGKLLAVEPEYRHALYKKIMAKRRGKTVSKGSPMLPGSFENGKRR
jgi:hypothetical protein